MKRLAQRLAHRKGSIHVNYFCCGAGYSYQFVRLHLPRRHLALVTGICCLLRQDLQDAKTKKKREENALLRTQHRCIFPRPQARLGKEAGSEKRLESLARGARDGAGWI